MNNMVHKLAFAFAICLAPAVQSATVHYVDLDGKDNIVNPGSSSLPLTRGKTIELAAGDWELSFVDGPYTAFSRFDNEFSCTDGASCTRGWENSVQYTYDNQTFGFGDGNASGGLGPISGGGYFASAAESFANTLGEVQLLSLAADTDVTFFIFDNNTNDNRGGISLKISAVPLPAAAWLFVSALAGMFGFKRFKRSNTRSDDLAPALA